MLIFLSKHKLYLKRMVLLFHISGYFRNNSEISFRFELCLQRIEMRFQVPELPYSGSWDKVNLVAILFLTPVI